MKHVHPLKAYRERQEPPLTQRDLARLLGVSRVTVTRWEAGSRPIDDDRVPEICEKTGIAVSELRPKLADLIRKEAPSIAPDIAEKSRARQVGQ